MSRSFFRLLFAICLLAAPGLRADDWPQWLGPQRDSVWREDGIVTSFPPGGPPVVWRAEIGAGYSGPAVAEGRVFVFDRQISTNTANPNNPFARGSIPGVERVLCLDAANGKQLWRYEYDCPYTMSYPAGPRTTPLVSDGKVFTLGARRQSVLPGRRRPARVLWSRDFKKDLHHFDADVGFCRKPVAGRQPAHLPGRRLQHHRRGAGQGHRQGNLARLERQGTGILFPGDFQRRRRPAAYRLGPGVGQLAGPGDGPGLLVLQFAGAHPRRHDDSHAAQNGRFVIFDLLLQRLLDAQAGRRQARRLDPLDKASASAK